MGWRSTWRNGFYVEYSVVICLLRTAKIISRIEMPHFEFFLITLGILGLGNKKKVPSRKTEKESKGKKTPSRILQGFVVQSKHVYIENASYISFFPLLGLNGVGCDFRDTHVSCTDDTNEREPGFPGRSSVSTGRSRAGIR